MMLLFNPLDINKITGTSTIILFMNLCWIVTKIYIYEFSYDEEYVFINKVQNVLKLA